MKWIDLHCDTLSILTGGSGHRHRKVQSRAERKQSVC